MTGRCGYLLDGRTKGTQCEHTATHRSDRAARCDLHTGHLSFTERWDGNEWQSTPITDPCDAALYAASYDEHPMARTPELPRHERPKYDQPTERK